MPGLEEALTTPFSVHTFVSFLFDLTVKGLLILALAGIVTAALRRVSAATRHLVWSLALCSLLLLPLATLTLPEWRVAGLPDVPYLTAEPESPVLLGEAPVPPAAPEPSIPNGVTTEDRVHSPSASPSLGDVHDPGVEASTPVVGTSVGYVRETLKKTEDVLVHAASALLGNLITVHWTVWVLALYLGGVLFVLTRFVVGTIGVARLAFGARPVRDPAWMDLADEIGDRLFLTRRVTLLRSARTAMPMTWGWWRPVVLLPAGADEWSDDRKRCVLTHEFAHIKRWDCLTQALAQLACALYWYLPLVWIAARQLREEREIACDDVVLSHGTRPSDYASHLMEIARATRTTLVTPLSAVAMARPSQLEGRIMAILDAARRRTRHGRATMLAGVVLAVLVLVPVASMRPSAGEDGPDVSGSTQEYAAYVQAVEKSSGTYHWSAIVAPGKTLTIKGVAGNVRAVSTTGREAQVVARFDGGPQGRLMAVEDDKGVTVCVAASFADECMRGAESFGDMEVDFAVQIPEGVHLRASVVEGDIQVLGIRGDVQAESVDGDITVDATGVVDVCTVDGDVTLRTALYGRAKTVDGDVFARLGSTSWPGRLAYNTVDGDITVELPEDAHTEIDLRVQADGEIKTAIPLEGRRHYFGSHYFGKLGDGGRLLSLESVDGDIAVLQGDRASLQRPDEPRVEVYMRSDVPEPSSGSAPSASASVSPDGVVASAGSATSRGFSLRLEELEIDVSELVADVLDETMRELHVDLELDEEGLRGLKNLIAASDGYARELRSAGLQDASRGELLAARLLGVDAEYVRALTEAGLCPDVDDVLALKAVGVDVAFIRSVASQYDEGELCVDKIVELHLARTMPDRVAPRDTDLRTSAEPVRTWDVSASVSITS